jgi:uncharacterized protein (DUF427 family)
MAKGHTITMNPATSHVVVTLGGEKIAETDHAVLLDETGLPTRYYLPRADVRTDLLRSTDLHTTCPFKGEASYWSAEVGGEIYSDLVWSYETPIPDAAQIAGLMCFYPDRVELTVDDGLISAAGLPAPHGEPLVHYSPGVDVRIGRPERYREPARIPGAGSQAG